jgi:pyruvate kinase
MNKKTKIVATVGPASETLETLEQLLLAGMNVMRLNFSHALFDEAQKRVDSLRQAVKNTGLPAAIIQDLGGPKIRLGDFEGGMVKLVPGDFITITTEQISGNEKKVSINYPHFPREVKVGEQVMLDDGRKKFEVVKIFGEEVLCKIIIGGDTKSRRGVNLPDSDLSVAALTEKDRKDLEFGLKNNVDFVALSFVRSANDIKELRILLNARKSHAGIIAKIETPQAVANMDAIIEASDAIMVARGDLAIEVPFEKVPMIQKTLIEKCNLLGKPIITATQMLVSMVSSPTATRAEVSDVANAILDGSDAVMLSEETTVGEYAVEAVKTMSKIAVEVERDYPEKSIMHEKDSRGMVGLSDSISGSAVKTAHDVGAKSIIALTESGFTARMISRYRPAVPVLALSPNDETSRKLCLSFGCNPVTIKRHKDLRDVFDIVRKFCLDQKIAERGDKVVVAAGAPFDTHGVETNMILVETV